MLAVLSLRPIRRDDLTSTVACVVRSGRPALRAAIRTEDLDRHGTAARLYRRLAPRSALVVPLVSGDTLLGTVSLCYSHSGRSHTPHHVPQAQRFAIRVAAALVAAVRAIRPAPPHQIRQGRGMMHA
jgi:GAF domain-containing protein